MCSYLRNSPNYLCRAPHGLILCILVPSPSLLWKLNHVVLFLSCLVIWVSCIGQPSCCVIYTLHYCFTSLPLMCNKLCPAILFPAYIEPPIHQYRSAS